MSSYALPGALNLCQNPDFELSQASYTYWNTYTANGNYQFEQVESWSGNACYRFNVTSLGSYFGFYSPAVQTDPKRILATPGLPYSAAFRIMGGTDVYSKTARVGFVFKNAAGGVVAEVWGDDTWFETGRWFEIKMENQVAPAGTNFIEFRCFANHYSSGFAYDPVFPGEWFYIDGADIRQSETIDSFVAGNQGPRFGWTGTAHQSTSYRNAQTIDFHVGRRGLIKITPELYLADKLNNLGEEITHFIKSGNVDLRSDRSIKMAFKGELTAPTEITAFSDYIAPYLTVERFDDTGVRSQVGLYSTAPMVETISANQRIGVIDAKDITWNLSESTFSGYYSIPAGANYVNEVIKILLSEGFTRYSITPSAKVLPLNRTWKAEASKLEIINDLLESIGYYSIFADNYGIITSFAYRDLLTTEPGAFYFSGQGSEVVGAIRKEPLIDSIYNYVKVIHEDTSNPANSFVYELKNENVLSPTSIPRLGRTKFTAINDSQIESLAVAQAKARQIIQDSASLYTRYTMQTLPDPTRSCWEIYDTNILMNDGGEALVGQVRVNGWDLGFTPSTAIMTHYLNRLELI